MKKIQKLSFRSMEQYKTVETFTYDITSLFASQRCADQTSDLRDLGNLGLGEHTKTVHVRRKNVCTFWSHDDMFLPI